jgi:hypothetical protein
LKSRYFVGQWYCIWLFLHSWMSRLYETTNWNLLKD